MENTFTCMFVVTGKSAKFAATRIYLRKKKTVAHN